MKPLFNTRFISVNLPPAAPGRYNDREGQKMNKTRIGVIAVCMLAAALGGCARTGAIYNVNDAPAVTPTGKALTAAQVKGAIVAAGTSMGWRMVEVGPGKIEGTLNLRTHVAVVDIPYSGKAYSLIYKRSEGLNETNGTIHSNYNGWVQNLDRAIRTEISRL